MILLFIKCVLYMLSLNCIKYSPPESYIIIVASLLQLFAFVYASFNVRLFLILFSSSDEIMFHIVVLYEIMLDLFCTFCWIYVMLVASL